MANINGLQNELTRFHMSLPPDLLLSDQTVTKYMASPQRAGYVFLHAHLAISHMELYRFSLPGQRDKVSADILRRLPREFVARSQKQAIAHAMCLARFYDAIQTEVDQRDHGMGELPSALSIPLSLPLAGDYSTFLLSTHCVRFLLIALQYELFRGVAHVTTAPLWRSVEGDETHLYFLLESVQRVVRPWGCILKVAQQAVCFFTFLFFYLTSFQFSLCHCLLSCFLSPLFFSPCFLVSNSPSLVALFPLSGVTT